MRKLLIAVALVLPLPAVADENDEPISAPDASEREESAADTLKYYRSWLGEECIDLSEECIDLGNCRQYYNWKRDVSYAGLPLFLSSFIIKDRKKAFPSACFDPENHSKTKIDNYSRFAPYAAVAGLKLAGVKGRSDWSRLMLSTILSNAVMATAVNATKYSVKEMRPDNSTRNSFPSGHTATAFVAATVLHKEYGLTRSPWYSVGGYAVATATGVMRILNNRHWVSDVVAGAGIGIISTELGYFLGDIIMGNSGIQHLEKDNPRNTEHPSFFDVQLGVGLLSGKLEFENNASGANNAIIDLGTSTSAGIEGAYFINRYLGLGGMARVTATPVNVQQQPDISNICIEDNRLIDSSLDVGVYGNLPLGEQFSLGMKLLAGVRLSDGIKYEARNDAKENDIMSVQGSNSFNYVTGISATWHYKPNFAWKVFIDLDSSNNTYTYTNRYYSDEAKAPILLTLGASFTVTI